MEKKFFAPGMEPSNADEIRKVAEEAEKALEKYPDSVTKTEKNDGAIEIDESHENLEEVIDDAVKAIEKK